MARLAGSVRSPGGHGVLGGGRRTARRRLRSVKDEGSRSKRTSRVGSNRVLVASWSLARGDWAGGGANFLEKKAR